MGFIAFWGTSNMRQLDVFARVSSGRYKTEPYHTVDHSCCILGNNLSTAESYISNLADIRIASYPGLNLGKLSSKQCYAGPYGGKKVEEYLEKVCQDPDFSGSMAFIMLGNDEEFLLSSNNPDFLVKKYLEKMGNFFARIPYFHRVRLALISTVLHRQSDFQKRNKQLLINKNGFNASFLRNANNANFNLTVNNRFVPYKVVDMGEFLPPHDMKDAKYYCCEEVLRNGSRLKSVHIKAEYMEKYLTMVKAKHVQYCKARRRQSSMDMFTKFCRIDVS